MRRASLLAVAASSLVCLPIAAAQAKPCPGNPNALGTSRVVQIDTTGGPGFGFQHYKFYDFLKPGEIVLTFDDGPLPRHTTKIVEALNKHCTRATFFPVGKLTNGYPEILKMVAEGGHTIGSHTWTHPNLAKKKLDEAKDEIESTISVVKFAIGRAPAPFFRFPQLKDTPELIKYLGGAQHRDVLDRYRLVRLQARQCRRHDQAGHAQPEAARQGHYPPA